MHIKCTSLLAIKYCLRRYFMGFSYVSTVSLCAACARVVLLLQVIRFELDINQLSFNISSFQMTLISVFTLNVIVASLELDKYANTCNDSETS